MIHVTDEDNILISSKMTVMPGGQNKWLNVIFEFCNAIDMVILLVLNSYIFFSWSDVIITIIIKQLLSGIIKTLTLVSNNEEKYLSLVCIKATTVQISLLAAVYSPIPKSRLKYVQHNNPSATISICQSLPIEISQNPSKYLPMIPVP